MEYQLNVSSVKQRDPHLRYTGKRELNVCDENLLGEHLCRDIDEDSFITIESEALVELRKEIRTAIDRVNDRLAEKYPELWGKSVNGVF